MLLGALTSLTTLLLFLPGYWFMDPHPTAPATALPNSDFPSQSSDSPRFDVPPSSSPVTEDPVDPFFTSTSPRQRLCDGHTARSHRLITPAEQEKEQIQMKLVFVEENFVGHALEAQKVKFNLIQSLKRNGHEDFEFVKVSENCSVAEKISALEGFLRHRLGTSRAYVLISSSTNLLFGASPQQLVARLDTKTRAIFAKSVASASPAESEISLDPFIAFGRAPALQEYMSSVFSSLPLNEFDSAVDSFIQQTLQNVYLKKRSSLKLDVDFRRSVLAHTSTAATSSATRNSHLRTITGSTLPEDHAPWVLKSAETDEERGGSGLGRGYCLLHRAERERGSRSCNSQTDQPDVLLFASKLSADDRKGYNFLVFNYLNAAPLNMKFSTKYNRKKIRLVASLTTLPHRLLNIHHTLDSLVSQHVKPDVIYLNIPITYTRFNISADKSLISRLINQFNNKYGVRFVVTRLKKDWGPLSKLLPVLYKEQDPATLLITVDDDMVFKPTLFGILLQRHLNSPKMAFGASGQMVDIDRDDSLHVRTAWKWKSGAFPVDILEGFTGAIYRRDFFDVDMLAAVPSQCFSTDDIWISAHLARRGIPRVKLALGWGDTAEFSDNDKISPLRDGNLNGTKRNDACAALLLDMFQLHWVPTALVHCSFESMLL